MMKLERKRTELLSEMERRRRAKLPLDGVRGEFVKVKDSIMLQSFLNGHRSGMITAKLMRLISSFGRKTRINMETLYHPHLITINKFSHNIIYLS